MTVEPGFGGQSFLDVVLPKIRRTRELIVAGTASTSGSRSTAASSPHHRDRAEAGADVFVAGSAVYGAADPAEAARRLRAQAQTATDAAWWRPAR